MGRMIVIPPPDPWDPAKAALGPRNAPGTAGLIMGLLSVVLTACGAIAALAGHPLPVALILGLVTAILGVIFGWAGRRDAKRGMATNGWAAVAALACGTVGGLAAVVVLVLSAAA
jgi:amino acid transporter